MPIRIEQVPTGRTAAAPARLVPALVALALFGSPGGCKPRTNEFAPPPPPEVTVAHPVRRPVTRYLEYTGTTEAFQSVELRARVSGFLEEFNFKPGAAVKKGELLFVIDKRPYQAAVDRAHAQVLADEAAYKAAESDAKIAEELAAQRAGSEIDKITKIGRRDSARAAVEAAKAALESANLDLEFCEVRAPIDGRITKNLVDVGNLVGAAGQPTVLATLVSAKPIYVSVDASESDVLEVRRMRMAREPQAEPGQRAPGEWRAVDLATADRKEFDIHGRIDYVDPALNPLTGTIRVRCQFDNEKEFLLPGMFVRLRIVLDTAEAILAPDIALLFGPAGRYALVVNDKDVVEARPVKIGTLDGALRAVLEGLEATDRVVVNGLLRARPGATVEPTLKEIGPRVSLFFIRRPIVACVIAILIIIMGAVAFPTLPVAQYPPIAPPIIRVSTIYPGASAQVLADTVAAPIEQQVNGVDRMIYMESNSASDGSYTLNVSFEVGTDVDIASVLVQNRVSIALAQLPEEVRRQGVITNKVSTSIVSVFALTPQDPEKTPEYTDLYLANYLLINVNDRVKRIPGVGDTLIRPGKDYGMRIWLDPDKLKARGLTTVDVNNALREQNVQVAAGVIGQPPVPAGQGYQFTITTLGRLETPEQFEGIIVRADGNRVVYLKDVARVELGAKSYDTLGRMDSVPSALMVVYQSPGGNSVKVAENLRKLIAEMSRDLPNGLEFRTVYDTSNFVVSAIEEVYKTIFEATGLVILVVLVFLGSIRSTIIPIAAIPVSLIGTFFAMTLFGFSLNLPTLFGLILAIGIVVDDAIVVVENVERNLSDHHLPPKDAASRAMMEVFGPVIGISLVLMAVFLPTAALPGISGQLYRQFALTIAASTFFSALCALTLSPALAGVILREHRAGEKHNLFKRGFDRAFDSLAHGYAWLVRRMVHPAAIGFSLAGFGAACFLIFWTVTRVPTGFVPDEDKGLIIAEVWLPDSASQERTLAVVKQVEKVFRSMDGVDHVGGFQGFSIIAGNGSNYGVVFAGLRPWSYRVPRGRDFQTMRAEANRGFSQIQDGFIFAFFLPAVEGVGNAAGFDLRVEDRGAVGRQQLEQFVHELTVDGNAQSKLENVSSAYRAAVPQLFADIDREKAKKLGISLQDVFSTLSVNLGSAYVNDFNRFGRTWQVDVQADSKFRYRADQVKLLQVRSARGDMIPLGALLKVEESRGPDRVIRYNLYPSASINGVHAPGVSTGEAMEVVEDMIRTKQPQGIGYEWTALAYQEKTAAGTAGVVFILALTVVYLILSALYESWTIPLAVILSIPLAVLGAMLGLLLRGMDNNIYTQVGLVLLVGLGAKNAILIVEFAKTNREGGMGIVDSVVEAARLRLRPILMTALAFILGVFPLVHATGAGAASRQAIGTAVFFGMIGNTFLGLVFTPVLYVAITAASEKLFRSRKGAVPAAQTPAPPPAH